MNNNEYFQAFQVMSSVFGFIASSYLTYKLARLYGKCACSRRSCESKIDCTGEASVKTAKHSTPPKGDEPDGDIIDLEIGDINNQSTRSILSNASTTQDRILTALMEMRDLLLHENQPTAERGRNPSGIATEKSISNDIVKPNDKEEE